MDRKKRKWITVAAVFLFFLAGGLWYFLREQKTAGLPTETTKLQSVFQENSESDKDTSDSTQQAADEEEKAPTASLVVYVCGAVNSPGIYTLSPDCRLYEAVAMTGGFSDDADLSYHNLARELADGERIYIYSCEETEQLTMQERLKGEAPEETEGLVNLNTAGKEQLMTLPGIGEAKAERILEYRRKVGQFTAAEEIMNVSGIGEAMFEKIKEKITVK